jgi:hypothetical protein
MRGVPDRTTQGRGTIGAMTELSDEVLARRERLPITQKAALSGYLVSGRTHRLAYRKRG